MLWIFWSAFSWVVPEDGDEVGVEVVSGDTPEFSII